MCFKLERCTRKGDPISAYFFIAVLELGFFYIKENKNIKGLDIFNNSLLALAYADDRNFE